MTRAIAGLDALRNAASAAIFGLHHSGHADKGRGRGSSVLRASVDVEYAAEKGDRTVRMRCTKAKDFDYPPPLAWALERYDLPWADADGQPLNSAVLVPEEDGPVARPVTEKIGHQPRRALELLEDLYRQGRRNLEDAGHDPNTARVTLEDWHNAMQEISGDSGNRSRIRRALLDSGHIKVENSFVYPTKL